MPHHIDQKMRDCIQTCTRCHNVCTETVVHCLGMGGEHAKPEHIILLLDCARICATSADFVIRSSPQHGRVCGVCAEVCEQCAQDCERLANGDETMTRCAQECRRCAESCRQMAA